MTCFTPKTVHITPVLMQLHWLPIKFRIELKIALLLYKALHGMAPRYIMDLLSTKPEGRHHLRSDDRGLLQIPKTNAKTLGDRAFAHAAPSIWSLLPFDIRQCETLTALKLNRRHSYLEKLLTLLRNPLTILYLVFKL